MLQRDDERRKSDGNSSKAKKKAVESTLYRLFLCILFSFLYKLTVLTRFCKPVVSNLLFRDFRLNDYPGNAFYANEKEPRVRPRFLMVDTYLINSNRRQKKKHDVMNRAYLRGVSAE